MTIERIVNYVMHTPHNTNRAVLIQMLRDLIKSENPEGPDIPGGDEEDKEVIYDGGTEN